MASPGDQARKTSGLPLPCMTGRASRWPCPDKARSSGQRRNSSGSEAKPDTTAAGCGCRNPSPCSATASAARTTACWARLSRQARMRSRSAFLAAFVSVLSAVKIGWLRERRRSRMRVPAEGRCRAAWAVGACEPAWPYKCRWAPFVRDHGPGQGQLPCGSYRPLGRIAPDAPRSPAEVNLRRVREKSMLRRSGMVRIASSSRFRWVICAHKCIAALRFPVRHGPTAEPASTRPRA